MAETIRTTRWRQARGDRQEASKHFPYGQIWNGAFYTRKRVRPVFVEKPHEIVVVTVYRYFS